jgi:hypothetical protein
VALPRAAGSSCSAYLDDAIITVIEGRVGSLDDIPARIKQVLAEAAKIEAQPIPSDDLEARVRAYVGALADKAAPLVRGIAAGEKLTILWPLREDASRLNQSGHAADHANALLAMALLHPERMVERLMAAAVAGLLPLPQREARLHELRAEEDQLRVDEESAVTAAIENGED